MNETPSVVEARTIGAIALITIDNPPVNALSWAVRAGLLDAVGRAAADDRVRAIVILCRGRTFVAGADIGEFGKPPQPPSLPEVLTAIENAPVPVIAALHGTALGGGFELALAAHARVALVSARVGLPEVRLGIVPGAGGTQRLPRLVGVEAALDMILSGEPIDAAAARRLGAVDAVVEDDLEAGALAFAETMIAEGRPAVRTRDRETAIRTARGRPEFWAARRAALDAACPEFTTRSSAVAAVETGVEEGFEAGLAVERRAFLELRDSPEAHALREAFFAARRRPKSS